MNAKKSFFSFTIFKKALSSSLPLVIIGILGSVLLFPVYISEELSDFRSYHYSDPVTEKLSRAGGLTDNLFSELTLLIYIAYAALCAIVVFHYIYNKRQTETYHSLPLDRNTLFFSTLLAGITAFIIPFIIGIIGGAVSFSMNGIESEFTGQFVIYCTGIMLMCFFTFCLMVLCCHITGNIFFSILLFILFNFAVMYVYAIFSSYASSMLFGFTYSDMYDTIKIFSPLVNFTEIVENTSIGGIVYPDKFYTSIAGDEFVFAYSGNLLEELILPSAIYALAGTIFTGIALLAYKKKHLEHTGSCITVPFLRPVIAVLISFGAAHLLVVFIAAITDLESLAAFIILLLICGFIVTAAITMIIYKNTRVLGYIIKNYIALNIIMLAAITGIKLDISGYETFRPELSEVRDIAFYSHYTDFFLPADELPSEMAYDIHSVIVENLEYFENSYNYFMNTDYYEDYSFFWLTVTYHMKDGSVISRDYSLYLDSEECITPGTPAYELTSALLRNGLYGVLDFPDTGAYSDICAKYTYLNDTANYGLFSGDSAAYLHEYLKNYYNELYPHLGYDYKYNNSICLRFSKESFNKLFTAVNADLNAGSYEMSDDEILSLMGYYFNISDSSEHLSTYAIDYEYYNDYNYGYDNYRYSGVLFFNDKCVNTIAALESLMYQVSDADISFY